MSYCIERRDALQVVLSGVVTYGNAMQIRADSVSVFNQHGDVQLVIQDISTFDSALVALLLFWQRWCTQHNKALLLSVQSQSVLLLLHSYQVTDLFTFLD